MNPKTKQAQGFTLIEVLISLLIFGVGIIGVTALTTQSQKITHQAYQAMIATWQLNDMMELIRANASAAKNSSVYIHNYNASIPTNPDCIDTGCTPSELATTDLNQWLTEIASSLPDGQGVISKTSNTYILTLHWDGNRVGAGATNACPNVAATDLNCQQLTFGF